MSVLTIKCTGISVSKEDNMAADENLAAADNGSPGEKKNYLSDFFFYDYNNIILQLEPRFMNTMSKPNNLGISAV